MKKTLFAGILILILLTACSSSKYPKEKTDALANCLAEKGVREYGAFWCPNCANQKKLFGSSYSIIMERNVYIECDPRGEKEQSALCIEKNIKKYPTWEFPNGDVVIGVLELETLAQKTECAF